MPANEQPVVTMPQCFGTQIRAWFAGCCWCDWRDTCWDEAAAPFLYVGFPPREQRP